MSLKKKKSYVVSVLILIIVFMIFLSVALYLYFFVSYININKEKAIPVNVMLLFTDEEGVPYAGFAGIFSPHHKRLAFISVPSHMGLYCKDEKDFLRMQSLYKKYGVKGVREAFSQTFALSFHFTVIINDESLSDIIDLIGGVSFFADEELAIDKPQEGIHIHLNPGGYLLDGRKMKNYLKYSREHDTPRKTLDYTEDLLLNLFIKFIQEKSLRKVYLSFDFQFALLRRLKGNLRLIDLSAVEDFVRSLKGYSVKIETMSGTPLKSKPNTLRPLYDGRYAVKRAKELYKDVTLARARTEAIRSDVRLSVLNATEVGGLADRIKIRMNYRGFKAVEYGNFGFVSDKSAVIIRSGEPEKGFLAAKAARTEKVYAKTDRRYMIDAILVLGYDYYEIPK